MPRVSRWFTLLAIPAFMVSQWAELRLGLPGREAFNLWMLLTIGVVLWRGKNRVPDHRVESLLAVSILITVIASAVINDVPVTVAIRGAIPYLAFAAIAVTALVVEFDTHTIRHGLMVAAATAVVTMVAAVGQTLFGQPAYAATMQDLAYPRWWEHGRAVGLVANPGRLAQLGTLWIALSGFRSTSIRVAVGLAAAGATSVALGGSRIALLTMVVFALVALVWRHVSRTWMIGVASVAAIAMFFVVQAVVPSAREDLLARSDAALAEATSSTISSNPTNDPAPGSSGPGTADEGQDQDQAVQDVRVAGARSALALVADRPVLGVGPGRFGSPTAWATGSEVHEQYDVPVTGFTQLDLGWAQISGELGLVGTLLLLTLLGSLGVRAVSRRSPVGVALIAALALLTVTGPGVTDMPLAAVALWWYGAAIHTQRSEITNRDPQLENA